MRGEEGFLKSLCTPFEGRLAMARLGQVARAFEGSGKSLRRDLGRGA